jgi:hypothetical protein
MNITLGDGTEISSTGYDDYMDGTLVEYSNPFSPTGEQR